MAKAQRGGATPKKKPEAGYAYKFKNARETPVERTAPKPRLQQKYETEIVPAMIEQFGYKNAMTVPRLTKVVCNIGLGEALKQPKLLEQSFDALGRITGQRPVVTRARKSIATFKLREGMKIGTKVTLRRQMMWDFADRLFSVALPRTRDFRGLSRKAFDGRGNYTMGIKEILIFPEVDIENLVQVPGMNICFSTTAKTDEEGRALLEKLGVPFRKA
jgi:large subunit ribosomal protein L5